MAEVLGESLYKLVNAMGGNEVTDAQAKEATANKTFGEVADGLTADINSGMLPIGGGGGGYKVTLNIVADMQTVAKEME